MNSLQQGRLPEYRKELDACNAEIGNAFFRHGAGLEPKLELQKFLDSHPLLHDATMIEEGKEALEAARSDEEKAQAHRLFSIILEYILDQKTLALTEQYMAREAAATISLDGKDVNYRYSSVLMVNETDRDRRRHISDLQTPVLQDLEPLKRQGHDELISFAEEHGFDGYQDYYFWVNGTDYEAFSEPTKAYLEATSDLYQSCLERYCPMLLGIEPDELEGHDISFLRRSAKWDNLFPADKVEDVLKKTLSGLGIDLDSQKNIVLDLDDREGKVPRAFCCPVHIPGDVRIVHLPQGGAADYHTVFHEMGHAEHFAHSDAHLPSEFKHKGDRGVTEGHAFILQSLIYEPLWLEEFLGIADAEFLHFNVFSKFMLHRALATRSLYELELRRAGDSDPAMPQRYVKLNKHYMNVSLKPERYLQVDEGYYTADYVRAWFFECQLRQEMGSRFGERWWRSTDAGDFLKHLWSSGRKRRVEDILDEEFGTTLQTKPLQNEFETLLS